MNIRLHFLLGFFVLAALASYSQTVSQKEQLKSFARERSLEYNQNKQKALAWAKLNNIPAIRESGASLIEIQYLDKRGFPHYYKTDNAVAAATISSQKVYQGGGAGLNLTGNGITVSEWDAGSVLATHQEFGLRVTVVDDTVPIHYHSTHVAGTIMASGLVTGARGMAYEANLRSYDWNDDVAELAIEGASGRLITNHSYGEARGWYNSTWYGDPTISTQEDYLFGFYDELAHDWDLVAYYAPQMLVCKSAGNDRGNSGSGYPADGPYDCLGNQGVAKNILTVGAVNDIPSGYTNPLDVVMTSFSSWGPADDGRIKPDIVANGLGLYSTDIANNTSYTYRSGTSMSCPSVAGSLALVQQHRQTLTGTPLLAATLKALVIHTADEAGPNQGPDYMFGWGLMNTQTAALKISQAQQEDVIGELTLADGSVYSREVIALGTEPLKATIVWTDVPGTPETPSLDPLTSMLVNDLDLRITRLSNTYFPWKLDRDNPTLAATSASENHVDNVEVVIINNPEPGATYTMVIDHTGTLTGSTQPFSIIISGISYEVAPVANFSANILNPASNATVYFTDHSQNKPTSWQWSFDPATVSWMNGTTSTTQNAQIQFNEPGIYTVTLQATNNYGSHAETKTAYITALDCVIGTLPFNESFSTTSIPSCWTQTDHQGNGQLWMFGTITTHSPNPDLTGNYAFLNSDQFGMGSTQDADLVSPSTDLSAYSDIRLQFDHYFHEYEASLASISYSLNDGETWTTIQTITQTTNNPEHFDRPLASLRGQPSVRFKWNYTGTWGYFWAIDNVELTGTATEFWNGSINTDWNQPQNWSNGTVPTAGSLVWVDQAPHQPSITSPLSNPAMCTNLTLEPGTILTIESGKALTVSGMITNNTGASGLIIESDGSLIQENANVEATLKRAVNAWGPDDGQGWHLLSSPVANQPLQPDFVSEPPSSYEDFYLWKEPASEWINSKSGSGPFAFNSNDFGTNFILGVGYLMAYATTQTKSFIGTLNTFDATMQLTHTSGQQHPGWNLCGNPFASALEWNAAEWAPENSSIGGIAKLLSSESGSYNDIISGESIPSNNGFFVYTEADGPVTIPAAARIHDGSWNKSANPNKIVFMVTEAESGLSQKSQLVLNTASSSDFDLHYDGEFIRFHAPAFYSMKGTRRLSTHSLPAFQNETTIEFGFEKNSGSNYKLELLNPEETNLQLTLFDLKTGYNQLLTTIPVYAFTAWEGDQNNRFIIYFGSVGLNNTEATSTIIYNYGNRIICQTKENGIIEVFDISGRLVLRKEVKSQILNSFNTNLSNGGYLVKTTTINQVVVRKIVI